MEPPIRGVAASSSAVPRHLPKSPPPDRYLSFSISPPSSAGDELTEDDIFDSAAEPASPQTPNHHHHQPRHHQINFGVLAALPASEPRSVFNHKASASSSSSSSSTLSSSRMIPTRKPPVIENKSKLLHQSAPVNVPVLSAAVEEERRRRRGVNFIGDSCDDDDEDEEGDVRMLPPHELVDARETPVVACSVLEGVGRTLKGRDLRRVRNAVWRKTGFID
ncbi:hypothetical protein LIER_33426 [Lithospermum erythrorhizon]|uniref:Senescence regulator n=1 Tax=Lithospermum erythrorhizon TaxID=34254 RepID=A0AAV3RWT6_LITER